MEGFAPLGFSSLRILENRRKGKDMKIEIRLKIDAGKVNVIDEEVLELDKPHDQLEQIGLSLDEAKDLLGQLQERIVAAQAAAFVEDNRCCRHCSSRLWSKEQASFTFRTPFGDVPVPAAPHLQRFRRGLAICSFGPFRPSSRATDEAVANSMASIRRIHSRHRSSLGKSSKSRSRSVSA